jgi:hypothetical protein
MSESVMEGHGSYNSHSHPQEHAAHRGIDQLFDRRLVEAISADPAAASCHWQLQLLVLRRATSS